MDSNNKCPEKYVADKTREIDRTDYGTPYFGLSVDGYEIWRSKHLDQRYQVFVHRLMAVAEWGFDSVCDKVIHHKNSIGWDNRIENIETTTQEEHVRKHFEQGGFGRSCLTEKRVAELRREYEGERTFKEIAQDEPVDEFAVREAIRGDSWEWVDEPPVKTDDTHATAKLTKENVKEIREKYEPYEVTAKELAKEFDVSITTVRDIVNYNSWEDVE